ncbi:MAG: signal peptidase II [Firmicutes bacterium HGW-Firmicutes-21]|nr:MAG: signal peptidase II [Firmicutes bacterium HGW-Firmicutes-21]
MLAFILVLFIVTADQLTKYLVVRFIPLYGEVDFIPFFINLTHVENEGASFGMLSGYRWVFMLFSTVAILGITVFLFKQYKRHKLLTVSLAFVLGGGIGNMIDRIFRGVVVDFFEFTFVRFAIFNVADMFITFGAVLLGIYVIFYEKKTEQTLRATVEESDENTDLTE